MSKNLAYGLSMPLDVTKGNTIITIHSRRKVIIDNYKSIISYDKNQILIRGNDFIVKITGENLSIKYFTNCDMQITGKVNNINWS